MNQKINKLLETIKTQNKNHSDAISCIKEKIQAELNPIFESDAELKTDIEKHESSLEYMASGDYPLVDKWSQAYSISKYSDFIEYLETYLEFIYIDLKNECFISCDGEAIIVNQDGDIFLGGKLIFNSDSYNSETKRNKLIEDYMESSGYFPNTFYQDHYGNLSLIKTQKQGD